MTWQGPGDEPVSGGGASPEVTPAGRIPPPPPVPPPPPASGAYTPPQQGTWQGGEGGPQAAMAWAPPTPAGPGAAALEYASTPARFVAYLVDGFVLSIVALALTFGAMAAGLDPYNLATLSQSPGGFDVTLGTGGSALALVVIGIISTAISAAYFILLWSGSGRATLGMRLLKLQVGGAADGRTLTRTQAAKRWFALTGWVSIASVVPALATSVSGLALVWGLILLVTVVTSPTRQGLHDRFAGSAMVQPAGGAPDGIIIGCLLLIGALVLVSLVSIVALIFLGGQVSTILSTVGESV